MRHSRPSIVVPPIRLLLADPPWKFGDNLPGDSRGAAKNYDVLDLAAIKAFALPPLADDALLLLWRVSSMVEEAYEVARTWGFEPKSEIVWNKKTSGGLPWFGMGHYVRASHETCIVARRGKFKVDSRSIRSTFESGASKTKHSAKPDCFYEIAEALCKDGPYAELFARAPRAGWHQWGHGLLGGYDAP